jgi:hypothetical protein
LRFGKYREEFHGYITTQKDNSFQIYVRNSNTNYIINDELLRECGYYESLNRFDFSTEGVQIYDDKIFLCYRLHRSDSGLNFVLQSLNTIRIAIMCFYVP